MSRSNEILWAQLITLGAMADLKAFYQRQSPKPYFADSDNDAIQLLERLENECWTSRNFDGYQRLRSARLQLLDLLEEELTHPRPSPDGKTSYAYNTI